VSLGLVLPNGRTERLGPRGLTLGRASSCELQLLDRSVSSLHARIVATSDGFELRDERSTNGTFVDGVRVTTARLRPGLEIALGRSVLTCVALDPRRDQREPRESVGTEGVFGASEPMRALRREMLTAARTPWPVLIRGESGTGKELVAHALHRSGPRAKAPLVALNAGALPENLVESELFGHERGAFTGANARRRGAFELADGGVLFLDEVGELPLAQQAKLLRVLETGELRRVGSETLLRVGVKFVCATHRDLWAMAAAGTFREDLLWRIAQHTLRVAPLRDRMEDVPSLARELCDRVSRELGREVILEDRAIARLLRYDWPGNVRELLGVLRAAAARAPDARVGEEHLGDFEAHGRAMSRVTERPPAPSPAPASSGAKKSQREFPDGDALLALLESAGSIAALSRILGRSRSALLERVRKARKSRDDE
jgi:two-component system response regulator GlrR